MNIGIRHRRIFPARPIHIALAILAGSILLWWPMLLNGFPLIFHDTNSYARLTPEIPRSYFYKLFVFFTGFKWSIWTTAFAQAFLASGCVFFLLDLLDFRKGAYFPITMAVLALVSSLPIFASFIMPDVFTGLMILLLFIAIFLFDRLAIASRILLFLTLLVATSVHLSHLALALGMTCLSIVWIVVTGKERLTGALFTLAACGTVAASFVVYHGVKHHHFVLSAAGGTFFMANLIEYGPARHELQASCPQSGYRLCRYRDQLPATADKFLWDAKSPFNARLSAFEGMREEANGLVVDTIVHRPLDVLSVSVRNSLRALLAVNPATDIVRMTSSVPQLRRVFGNTYDQSTVEQFDHSLQENNRFPVKLADILSGLGLTAAFAVIIYMLISKSGKIDPRVGAFLLFSLIAYTANAVICGTLSGVFDRYQSRMSWLIIFAALLLLFDWHRQKSKPS